jgi:amidase
VNNELWGLDACEVAEGIRKRKFSSREVVSACLQRADETNEKLNALTEIRTEEALATADRADTAIAKGEKLGALHGVPVVIKGNVDLKGWATVNGCVAFKDSIAKETSPCVQNWLNAGAIVIARTNTPEFCCRWETNNDVFGQTVNPWNSALTPGGSSGGTAVSLAAGMVPLGHGTDLGGSLRHPAQACGIASIKPTLGRVADLVPSEPEAPMGMQLMNTDGPMARRVADVRLGLQTMATKDWRDPWWMPVPLEMSDKSDLPIAVIIDPLKSGVSEQVASGVKHAANLLAKAGYTVEEVEPPGLADAFRIWKTICLSELLNGLKPAVEEICGAALLKALDHYQMTMPDLTIEKYHHAFSERRQVLRDWMGFFQNYSAIIAPVSTVPPQVIDNDIATAATTESTIESMRMVVAINALGLPSAVVPVGSSDNLPQVVQIIGQPFDEMWCLSLAETIEKHVDALTPINPH